MGHTSASDLYRRWIDELWNGDLDAAPDIVSADFIGHWPDREVVGPQALADAIGELHAMFEQIGFAIEVGPIVEGDLVAGRWSGQGTTPDGQTMAFTGNDILRVEGDRFVEFWQGTSAGA